MNPLTIYKSRLYRTPALLAVAAVAAILFNSTVASAIEDYGRLNHAGRWITDSKGRVIIIHGVNMPSKLPPAYPSAIGFKDDDGKFLEQLGFNGVRLTVERYAVEPTPGHFDPRYVEHMAGTIRMLARHGILSLVDFHQDEYGPVFHDNGYPDWMTVTDGLTNNWEVLFPFQYLENPANMRAFDNLWTNDTGPDGKPLQQDDAEILAYVVRRLRDEPGILGYEILNEPWPGSQWEDCALSVTGCPDLDQSYLGAYYAQVIPAVRGADPKHMIWFEPFSTFNYGVPTSVAPPSDPNLGFSFHDYSLCAALGVPSCDPVAEAEAVLSNAIAYSASTGDALLETEFGGGTDVPTFQTDVDLYDQYMMPWLLWSYSNSIDTFVGTTPISYDRTSPSPSDSPSSDNSTGEKVQPPGILLPPVGDNVHWDIVDVVTRPYPQRISGTPISWNYDSSADIFTIQYSTARADGRGAFKANAVTEIVVPELQYPGGYGVTVTGGRVISQPGADILKVAACKKGSAISVTVYPTPGISESCS